MQVMFTAELSRPEKWHRFTALPRSDTTGPAAEPEQIITVRVKLSEIVNTYENV